MRTSLRGTRTTRTGISRRTRRATGAVLALTLALSAAACGGGGGSGSGGADGSGGGARDGGPPAQDRETVRLPDLKGQKLQVAAVWTGDEAKNFGKVTDEFEQRTGAEVEFVPTGDSVATFIGSKIEGGQPPDVAMLPQVGVLRQFAEKGWAKPLDPATERQLKKNYSAGWRELGSHRGPDGKQSYGVYVKAANKSLIWYNTSAYETAGVGEPKTWKEFLADARVLADSGVPPVAVGGADGWVLTDWFENIYLSQAGPEKYDRLARHEIKWTDPSVRKALETLAELFGRKELLAGGNQGALRTEFPKSVTQVFAQAQAPEAASVFEGDFVGVNIAHDTEARIGEDAKAYPFPRVGAKPPVVTGGDAAVALKDTEAAHALLTFLASTDAAAIWAAEGGFVSPNKELDPAVYPNEVQRGIAEALTGAGDDFRFDMSDQAPAAFGGTKGEGEWKALQDFLKNPDDVGGAQRSLEQAALKAYDR
ncbi:ABC transporter substrate-binding protein [Streptomyces sp. HNM0574]|uniref:ABC transporter substrate-binding protein n=1 Tax=Streptomyces sp. HNM0574 TaxID=2714954 RepID=UPI00146A9867|nr:ABC transporter substrate-binding protein [Streptomyces sp. HNM0574]NLU67379.1 carbohydrate ABC transporter substrate-binding protein [Streptomyces sp. HNM0574]